VYPAPNRTEPSPAVLVCPGGGYHILAWDLEGTEVCEWLNSIGYTAVLLKYRVPRRENLARHLPPLQDAQRAMSLIRHHAEEWKVDPEWIGALGFSAGGHLAAVLSTGTEKRVYESVDAADKQAFRPNYTLLIYPGYLMSREPEHPGALASELKVHEQTPPTFMVMTQDDGVGVDNVLYYALALHAGKVPVELHVYPQGGHGYGLRKTELPVTHWAERATDWLRQINPPN
jgi:acetyl esterase/lipase